MTDSEWISQGRACQELSMGVQGVQALARSQVIRTNELPSGRVKYNLPDVLAFKDDRANWLPTAQAARLIDVAPDTLLRWHRSGRIKGRRCGHGLEFRVSDLEKPGEQGV